jgi:fructose-1-phosphate kinase PfkB-like protein
MIVEEDTGNTYAIYEPGQKVESDEINHFRKHFFHLLEKTRMILFCGSAQTPELANLYFELIQAAEKQGVRCGLDSSGIALHEGLKARPYMVKINRDELSELLGRPLSDLDIQVKALLGLCRSGISLVALSRGREGLLVTDGATCLEGVLVMENVVNFMGCGDSLLAGMASAILEGATLETITRRGVACGAANTQIIGAGFIDPALVRQLEPQVTIRSIF